MRKEEKKGLSNIFAACLIMLCSIAIVIGCYSLIKEELIKANLDNIEAEMTATQEVSANIDNIEVQEGNLKITVRNTGQIDIVGFIVKAKSKNNDVYFNNSVYLEGKQKLKPLEYKAIWIIPSPFGGIAS